MSRAMMVCDGEGYALTDGLEDHRVSNQAERVAQRLANERGESVWLSWSSDGGEDDEYSGEGVEFEPEEEDEEEEEDDTEVAS